jgi:cytochrome oxidase Cu insertion factor (SCO1/SenC/PrrC family)
MTRTYAVGLTLLCIFWLVGAAPQVLAADPEYFEALNLMYFSKPTVLPDLSLPDVDGKEVSLRAFRGKVILLNFWTTW